MVPQRELTTEDYINIFRRKWLLIAILAVVGGGLGFGTARILPKRYTSETVVLVEQPGISADIVKPVMNPDVNQRLATMQEEILSRSRLEPIIHTLSLYREDIARTSMDDLVGRLRSAIEVTAVQPMARTNAPGLPGFSVRVTFAEPSAAQQICSTVTSMFLEENLRVRQHRAEQTSDFIAQQKDAAKAKLDEQDARLAVFQRAHIGSLPDDQAMNLNILGGLAAELDAATQALARAQQDKTYAESNLAEQRAAWLATLEGRNPETYEQQITALEAQLTALKSKYTDDHPDVAKVKRDLAAARKMAEADQAKLTPADPTGKTQVEPLQLKALRDQIRQYELQIQDRTAQQEETRRKIKTYQARVESTPAIAQEYKALTRDYQSALEFYNGLLKNENQASMATDLEKEKQSEQFRVLDPASYPDRPSFPKLLNFLGGGFGGGLILGVGLALLLEMRDTSVRTDKDVEALLHLPVLAVVPTLKKSTGNTKANLSPQPVARR
jgi:polysaccharide chain length determinant protein (PEP-CTERM system associated)